MDWKFWARDPVAEVWDDFFNDRKTAVATIQELNRIFKFEQTFNDDRIAGKKPEGCRISSVAVCIPDFHARMLDDIARAERRRTGDPRQPANAQQFVGGIMIPLFFHTQRKRIGKLIEDYANGSH